MSHFKYRRRRLTATDMNRLSVSSVAWSCGAGQCIHYAELARTPEQMR